MINIVGVASRSGEDLVVASVRLHVVSVEADGEGSSTRNEAVHAAFVALGDHLIAGDLDDFLAAVVAGAVDAGVRIRRFGLESSNALNIGVSSLGPTTGAAAGLGVAINDLLNGEWGRKSVSNGVIRFDLFGGGESPARTTLFLILHRRSVTVASPIIESIGIQSSQLLSVDGLDNETTGIGHLDGVEDGDRVVGRSVLQIVEDVVFQQIFGSEFGLGEVRELGDSIESRGVVLQIERACAVDRVNEVVEAKLLLFLARVRLGVESLPLLEELFVIGAIEGEIGLVVVGLLAGAAEGSNAEG